MKTFSKVLLGAGAVAVVALGVAHADGWGWHGWQRGGPGWGGGPMQMGQMGPMGGPMGGRGGPMMAGWGAPMGGSGGRGAMMFERFDVNKDGTVTLEEFTQQRDDAMVAADTNKDGVIDKTEADAFILKMVEPMRDRMIARFDINGDGKISKDEIDSPMKKRFALFDRNDDGKVTQEELASAGPGMMGPGMRGPGMGRGWHGGYAPGWFGGPGAL